MLIVVFYATNAEGRAAVGGARAWASSLVVTKTRLGLFDLLPTGPEVGVCPNG